MFVFGRHWQLSQAQAACDRPRHIRNNLGRRNDDRRTGRTGGHKSCSEGAIDPSGWRSGWPSTSLWMPIAIIFGDTRRQSASCGCNRRQMGTAQRRNPFLGRINFNTAPAMKAQCQDCSDGATGGGGLSQDVENVNNKQQKNSQQCRSSAARGLRAVKAFDCISGREGLGLCIFPYPKETP